MAIFKQLNTDARTSRTLQSRKAPLLTVDTRESDVVNAREHIKDRLREVLRGRFDAITQEEASATPSAVLPEKLFAVLHWCTLFTTVYGISWTLVAVQNGELPSSILWKPMKLLKLAYPTLPVILGCWFARTNVNNGCRMTAGYYFANLKMGLLPSLGPGILIGLVLDKLVIRPQFEPFHVQEEFRLCMLPFAWMLGYLAWTFIQFGIPANQEAARKHWGVYARWRLEPYSGCGPMRKLRPISQWIQEGPHSSFLIIPSPNHGTFYKVKEAAKARSIWITMCCILTWSLLLVWWCVFSGEAWKNWWTMLMKDHVKQMIVDTDFPNLFFNTLTAPPLICATWRKEPLLGASNEDLVKLLANDVPDDTTPRSLFQEPRRHREVEQLFNELIEFVMTLSLNDLAADRELREIMGLSSMPAVDTPRRSRSAMMAP